MRKIHIQRYPPEPDTGEPIKATPEAMKRLFEEQSKDIQRCRREAKESSIKLENNICNHFNKLISLTDDLSELEQAIIDAKELYVFYEEFHEAILETGLMRLKSIIKKGEKRVEILKRNEIRTTKYIIKNDDTYSKIFSTLNDAFDCDYLTFRESIETANFHKLGNIKKKNVVQYLTYRLSYDMTKDWYSEVCEKMGWKKTICSGQGKKLEENQLIKKLNKILPMPEKE